MKEMYKVDGKHIKVQMDGVIYYILAAHLDGVSRLKLMQNAQSAIKVINMSGIGIGTYLKCRFLTPTLEECNHSVTLDGVTYTAPDDEFKQLLRTLADIYENRDVNIDADVRRIFSSAKYVIESDQIYVVGLEAILDKFYEI